MAARQVHASEARREVQAAQAMKEADVLAHSLRSDALAVEARDRVHSAAILSASDAATAQLRAFEQMELVCSCLRG
jgi:hypothetical protein